MPPDPPKISIEPNFFQEYSQLQRQAFIGAFFAFIFGLQLSCVLTKKQLQAMRQINPELQIPHGL